MHTFQDVDAAIREYSQLTGKPLSPLGPEPTLSDFYVPSDSQKDREIVFVLLGLGASGIIAYSLYRGSK